MDTLHSDYPGGEKLSIGCYEFIDNRDISSKEMLCLHAALGWSKAKGGGVLLLASNRQKAQERATWIAKQMPERKYSKTLDLICRFLETEVGVEHTLVKMLRKGVAFHHSGLSSEARYFVERLVEIGEVKILCATTTLAQGVNFPLSVAVIEGHTRRIPKRGGYFDTVEMQPWEFWNIAGRVGRTFEDTLGIVTFAYTEKEQLDKIKQYLSKDAYIVTSALIDLIKGLKDRDNIYFSRKIIENIKSASAFLQYIVHSLTMYGLTNVKADLEGVLRASFVFEQARGENPELAEDLIRIARLYIDDLERKKGKALHAYAKMADGTGFSSPSVDLIWHDWKENKVSKLEEWSPDNLFPKTGAESDTLINAIDTLSRIPEIRLGTEDSGQFSVERIARITNSWVNGESIIDIANNEYNGDVYKCISHINSVVSNLIPWGIRGIQHVSFTGLNDNIWEELDLVPSMIYHGVKTREAIALRMLNIPRFIAEGLVKQWEVQKDSNDDIFNWIERSTSKEWDNALPKNSKISGEECKFIWQVLEGKKHLKDIEE